MQDSKSLTLQMFYDEDVLNIFVCFKLLDKLYFLQQLIFTDVQIAF